MFKFNWQIPYWSESSSFIFNETLDKWIPEGWEDSALSEMIEIQNGFAFKSKDFKEEGIPVLKIKNVKFTKFDMIHPMFSAVGPSSSPPSPRSRQREPCG